MQKLCVGDPTRPICHLFTLGIASGIMQILAFFYNNMSVSPTQILALGVLPNVNPQREGFCVAVEYRLK